MVPLTQILQIMPNFPDPPIERKTSPISVADARKQLQEALDREDLGAGQRRAIAENTGTSDYLPPVLAPSQLPQPSWTPPVKEPPTSVLPHPEVSE